MNDVIRSGRVAIVHYWLVGMAGGEKVLEALCELYPDADIYTHVLDPEAISPALRSHRIHTTFVDRLPRASKWYQKYLPLMPLALEQLDLRAYDLVISSESGPAKGVLTHPDALHVCYCHSPMRYIWDMYHDYRAASGFVTRLLMAPIAHYLRIWDRQTALGVDRFVANSSFVARRIARVYRREADVLAPPVDIPAASPDRPDESTSEYYLFFGRLTAYKRADLAIEAFNQSGRSLLVAGGGEELENLKRGARSNVRFVGRVSDEEADRLLRGCRALVFPGLEDFGIVPVEAMARGKPVICFGRGGVLDSVLDGITGIYFDEPTAQALSDAIERFEQEGVTGTAKSIIAHARSFSRERFKEQFSSLVEQSLEARKLPE